MLVKVRQINDNLCDVSNMSPIKLQGSTYVGDKAALQDAEQRSGREKRASTREPELRPGNNAPKGDLQRDPAIGAHPFGHQLRWQLCAEETEAENGIAEIVVWHPLAAYKSGTSAMSC